MPPTFTITLPKNATGLTPPSNKGEKLKVDLKKICYPSILKNKNTYKGIIILNPIIDGFDFGSPVLPKDEKAIKRGLNSIVYKDLEDFKSLSPVDKKKVKQARGYKYSFYWLNGGKLTDQILLNYVPFKQQKHFIKVVMQPSRLTQADMEAFRAFWDSTFTAHPYLKLDNLFQVPKAITRLHVAVDMLNAHVGSFVVTAFAKKKTGASTKKTTQVTYQNPTGRPETIYLPHDPDSSATEYLYDKKKDMEKKGKAYPYGEFPMSRFEMRLKPELAVYKLHKLKNHFKTFNLEVFDHRALKGQSHTHTLFTHLALVRTLEKVTPLVPEKLRKKYMAFFTDNLIPVWRPDDLQKGLIRDLERLGFIKKE